MRALILIAGALVLAACSNNDQHDNTTNVDENLTAENIVSNDVTAIDAVTGDAANMAGESDINDLGNATIANEGSMSSPTKPAPRHSAALPTKGSSAGSASENSSSSSTVSNAATNAAD